MLRTLILFILVAELGLSAPTTTTSRPLESDDSDDELEYDRFLRNLDEDCKASIVNLLSEDRSSEEMVALLQRTIDIAQHRPRADRSRRGPSLNESAIALGRILTSNQGFGEDLDVDEEGDARRAGPSTSEEARDDPDYCPNDPSEFVRSYKVPPSSMQKLLELRARGRTDASLQKLYSWYDPTKLEQYRRCITGGGSVHDRMRMVNDYVLSKLQEYRNNYRKVRGHRVRRWAMIKADELRIPRSYFRASRTWLYRFKKNKKIRSRAVTEYISRSELDQQDVIDERIDEFLSAYERRACVYSRHRIFNMDQTPFNYEPTTRRTLDFIGRRNVRLRLEDKNKATHSFTSQPLISREGKVIGKLWLVMQEPQGRFGPVVEARVRNLEAQYGNVRVVASTSGKMSTDLTKQWIREVLIPASTQELRSLDTDTDLGSDIEHLSIDDGEDNVFSYRLDAPGENPICSAVDASVANISEPDQPQRRKPHALLLIDSWSGQTAVPVDYLLTRSGFEVLHIPRLCTRYVQPLDVVFNLQYKKFVNEIFEEADDPRSEVDRRSLSSRENIINMHSLVWNQFGSEAYTDMLRYAWHDTDPNFNHIEMSLRPKPRLVSEIQFELNRNQTHCEHHDESRSCGRPAFIRCAHCGKILCLKHFLERVCFHEVHEERAGPSGAGIQFAGSNNEDNEYESSPDRGHSPDELRH